MAGNSYMVESATLVAVLGTLADSAATGDPGTTTSLMSYMKQLINDTGGTLAGVPQVIEASVTAAANAGATTVATVTAQPCVIHSLVVHADAALTGDLTNAPVTGGAGGAITFLSAAATARANLAAENTQVGWSGAIRLPAASTIVVTPAGTGATALDLTVTIVYRAAADGGYLA